MVGPADEDSQFVAIMPARDLNQKAARRLRLYLGDRLADGQDRLGHHEMEHGGQEQPQQQVPQHAADQGGAGTLDKGRGGYVAVHRHVQLADLKTRPVQRLVVERDGDVQFIAEQPFRKQAQAAIDLPDRSRPARRAPNSS